MSTVVPRPHAQIRMGVHVDRQWVWLAGGLVIAFLTPFVFADLVDLPRDAYYGVYAAVVLGFVTAWAWTSHLAVAPVALRNWRWAVGLGLIAAAVLAVMVLRTEDATVRPDGWTLIGAVAWRGVVYGAIDGLLLSVFPILAVFTAFEGHPARGRRLGVIAVGALALLASLAMTATYHLGYSDFRSEKLRKPLIGDVVWSTPTLLTLSPLGAPIAHIGLHTAAVLHSYETDVFLPPHTP